jgi:hypothetical protein
MICSFRDALAFVHSEISLSVRAQPIQKPNRGSMTQMPIHGEAISIISFAPGFAVPLARFIEVSAKKDRRGLTRFRYRYAEKTGISLVS